MNESSNTCSKCHSLFVSVLADGLCETCRSNVGETPADASVPLLDPKPTVDLHGRPVTDDPKNIPTVQSDETPPNSHRPQKSYLPDPIPGIRILDVVGTGGSATVYRGLQLGANRDCAVKFVNRTTHPSSGERLGREARAIATLDHPNIIRVYSCELESPSPYLVMEYAAGGSLVDRLKANPNGLPIDESVALIERVAHGIAHAHQHGIVHRDIKPGNLLLDAAGTVKVSDFGLARNFERDATITKSQAILGTPAYMSPEQARSEEATPQSDVYGIGAVLYDCLTGRPPFPTRDYVETLEHVKKGQPTPPREIRQDIPPELEAICLKCLKTNPAKRYANAEELAGDLARVREGKSTIARPRSLPARAWRSIRRHHRSWAIAVVTLLAVAVATVSYTKLNVQPQRKMTQEEATRWLRRGKPLVLIDDSKLRIEEYVITPPFEPRAEEGLEGFSFLSRETSILGLLKDPGIDSYTVSGEFYLYKAWSEMEKGIPPGNDIAGLIVGHEGVTNGPTNMSYFTSFRYSEILMPKINNEEPYHRADVEETAESYTPLQSGIEGSHYKRRIRIDPPGIIYRGWRTLNAKVSPAGIVFECNGETIDWPAEKINSGRKIIEADNEPNFPNLPKPRFPPREWSPRMGIGLYIHGCWLSVRNLTITPNP